MKGNLNEKIIFISRYMNDLFSDIAKNMQLKLVVKSNILLCRTNAVEKRYDNKMLAQIRDRDLIAKEFR